MILLQQVLQTGWKKSAHPLFCPQNIRSLLSIYLLFSHSNLSFTKDLHIHTLVNAHSVLKCLAFCFMWARVYKWSCWCWEKQEDMRCTSMYEMYHLCPAVQKSVPETCCSEAHRDGKTQLWGRKGKNRSNQSVSTLAFTRVGYFTELVTLKPTQDTKVIILMMHKQKCFWARNTPECRIP